METETIIDPAKTIKFAKMTRDDGDLKTIYNIDNEDEVAAARKTFNDLKAKGFTAFHVKKDGEKGTRMDEFDAQAGTYIMVPQYKGG